MANTDFGILLKTLLDKSGINSELEQVQKIVNKYSIDIMPELKTASLKNQMKAISQEIANDFNKAFGTNLTGNDVFKAFENQAKQAQKALEDQAKAAKKASEEQAKAIEEARKAQEKHNETVRKGKELAKKQADDRFTSNQSAIYDDIKKNQSQIYSLKQKLLSSDKLETEEINKQISALELKNKYNERKLSKNGMVDTSLEKSVQQSRETLENQYRLTDARKTDSAIAKETAKADEQRAKALKFTREESEKLASAMKKYSYGDSTDANAMMKRLNDGMNNFKDLSSVDKTITTISSDVDKIIDGLKHSHEQSLKALNGAISAEEKAKKQIQPSIDNGTYSTQIDKLVSQFQKYGLSVDEAEEKVKELRTTLLSMETAPSNESLVADYQKWEQQIKDVNVQLDQAKLKSEQITEANKIQLSMGANGNTTAQIEVLRNNFTKLGLSADEVKTKMSGVDTEVQQLKTLMNSGSENSAIITQFEKLQNVLTQTQNNLKTTRSEFSLLATEQQRLSLANTIEAWNQKNTRATKEVRAENERYVASLRDLNTEMTKLQFWNIQTGFKQAENSMRTLNKLGASLKDQIAQAAQSFSQWITVSSVIMGVVYKTKQAVTELKNVNTYLTEISKANDQLSKTQLEQIGNNSFDISGKYGKTATDFLSGVQEASRAGYTNAEGIAELSVAAQGAGDMTAELSNQLIIATDKAYKMGGSITELQKVLDGMNYITNHNAVNMTNLSEGMSIVGSTAASLGVDVDQLAAAIGTMSATTQQSGSEVARAFKAILLNIRQVSDEEEGIDTEGLTKYEKACNALGVSLKETKDGVLQTRDAMEVLKELSEEYNKLSENDVRRADLLNSVGGKLRSTQLDALLRQWDTYESMLQQYKDGTDSMAKEAEKTANSWEGSMNRLSNTWTKTVGHIANSDAIIEAINGLNSLLSVVDNVTGKLGSLGTIGLSAGIFAGFKNIGKTYKRTVSKYHYNCCFEYALYA